MADESLTIEDHPATKQQLSDWCDLPPKGLDRFLATNIPVKISHGRYLLKATIRNYIRFLRDARRDGSTGKARAELLVVQTRLARVKEAVLKGDLIKRSLVVADQAAIYRLLRARLLAAPARISGRLPHLSISDIAVVEGEIRDALMELSETEEGYQFPSEKDDGEEPEAEDAA